MTEKVTPPHFLSPQEAAVLVGVHPRTIRRRIADGTLAAYRLAGTRAIRVNSADVNALLRPVPSGALLGGGRDE